jgi:hypothetical protein
MESFFNAKMRALHPFEIINYLAFEDEESFLCLSSNLGI